MLCLVLVTVVVAVVVAVVVVAVVSVVSVAVVAVVLNGHGAWGFASPRHRPVARLCKMQ